MLVWRSGFPRKKSQYSWIIVPLVQAGAANHRHRAEKAQLETDGGIGPNRNNHKEGGAAEQGYEKNNLSKYCQGTRQLRVSNMVKIW